MQDASMFLADVFSVHPFYKRYEMPLDTGRAGQRSYSFLVDDEFFDPLSFSVIKKGQIEVQVTLSRQRRSLMMRMELRGYVVVRCVRCLTEVRQPLSHDYNIMIKFLSGKEQRVHKDIDLLLLPEGTTTINMAPEIYDYINISLPAVVVCGNDGCNPEMEQLIHEYSQTKKEVDRRWQALLQEISERQKT